MATYRAALEERPRERVPLDWAMTQNNLGNALAKLGERERGTARLESSSQPIAPPWGKTRESVFRSTGRRCRTISAPRSPSSESARTGRRVLRRLWRPIAPRWKRGRASEFRSIGRRRRRISELRSKHSEGGRAGRRVLRRRWQPIAPRWRNIRASALRSNGQRRTRVSALRS